MENCQDSRTCMNSACNNHENMQLCGTDMNWHRVVIKIRSQDELQFSRGVSDLPLFFLFPCSSTCYFELREVILDK